MTNSLRMKFEDIFGDMPFEFDFERHGENDAWPGSYLDYHVECAWNGFEAGHKAFKANAFGLSELQMDKSMVT